SLLFAEKARTDTVKLGTFYLRRARRLLPALLLTLAGVLLLALIFLPDQVASLRGDVVAAIGYSTNWYFIVDQKSYWEAATPSLGHRGGSVPRRRARARRGCSMPSASSPWACSATRCTG